jgi:hypothetical protein
MTNAAGADSSRGAFLFLEVVVGLTGTKSVLSLCCGGRVFGGVGRSNPVGSPFRFVALPEDAWIETIET